MIWDGYNSSAWSRFPGCPSTYRTTGLEVSAHSTTGSRARTWTIALLHLLDRRLLSFWAWRAIQPKSRRTRVWLLRKLPHIVPRCCSNISVWNASSQQAMLSEETVNCRGRPIWRMSEKTRDMVWRLRLSHGCFSVLLVCPGMGEQPQHTLLLLLHSQAWRWVCVLSHPEGSRKHFTASLWHPNCQHDHSWCHSLLSKIKSTWTQPLWLHGCGADKEEGSSWFTSRADLGGIDFGDYHAHNIQMVCYSINQGTI